MVKFRPGYAPNVQNEIVIRDLYMSATLYYMQCIEVATHVAIAMTARPMRDASSTKQPNCSRIGTRILGMARVAEMVMAM
jgi:hypothetical protein